MQDRHESNLAQLSAHLREAVTPQRPRIQSSAEYVAAVSQHLARIRSQQSGAPRRYVG